MRTLAGQSIIVPTKVKDIDFTHILTLNETAATIWKRMNEGEFWIEDLAEALTDNYEVEKGQALRDAREIVDKMRGLRMISD